MRLIKIFTTLLTLATLVTGMVMFLRSPMVKLQSVEILLDPSSRESFLFEKIQSSLQASLAHYNGLPFWKVRLDDVMSDVKNDRRVRIARIQRDFPHHLRVIVVPHEPVMGLLDEKGRVLPVAKDATLLPALTMKDAPNFPLLRGKEFMTDEALRMKAIELLDSIPNEGRFQSGNISEILHSNKYGFEIFLSDQPAEIKMGEGEFDLKAGRVEKVLSYLHNRNMQGRVIDARFGKKVVVRLRGEKH
jgi:cell division septal protein FtsQ